VLVNEIRDLLAVFRASHRYRRIAAWFRVMRLMFMVVFYAIIYGWGMWYLMTVK